MDEPRDEIDENTDGEAPARPVSRRDVLRNATAVTGVALGGVAVGAAGGIWGTHRRRPVIPQGPQGPAGEDVIRRSYSPHGLHQPGIITPTPAVTHALAFDLAEGCTRGQFVDLLQRLSPRMSRLMAGEMATGVAIPQLSSPDVSLSITVGFGPGIFRRFGLESLRPAGFDELPMFGSHGTEPSWSDGDLLLLIAADDPFAVSLAEEALTFDIAPVARRRWRQMGAWRGDDASGARTHGRTWWGHQLGTGNPTGADLESALWSDDRTWFNGGTTVALHRILLLEPWHQLPETARDEAIGRRTSDGAPLVSNGDSPAYDRLAPNAHIAVAYSPGTRIHRRVVNLVEDIGADGRRGMLHMSFQADMATQLVPILRALDERDAMLAYIRIVGSSIFAIPPGYASSGYIGKGLFES